ncbi:hypothetical protein [Lentzea sp.]|uniref:hypothetical protein n=1 Tax=Lentzea sp. TaxID=56099 RepID=UPI002BAE70FA|nr:hypothetical protein [Lentzea sp.]HUQ54792.1 hypothetical protein [Lentzea sp.]
MIAAVLVRFAYLAVSNAFAALWLLRMSDREKDVEILALRHQLAVLRRQLGDSVGLAGLVMIASYSMGVNWPRAAWRLRRWSWLDRPEAAALLAAAADPGRDFDAVVVREYERAFHGDRFREVVSS